MKALDFESREHFEKRIEDLENELEQERRARQLAEQRLAGHLATSVHFPSSSASVRLGSDDYLRPLFDAALEALPFGLLITDTTGEVVFASGRLLQILGRIEGSADPGDCQLSDVGEINLLLKDPGRWPHALVIAFGNDEKVTGEHFDTMDGRQVALDSYPLRSGGELWAVCSWSTKSLSPVGCRHGSAGRRRSIKVSWSN